ncbi:MAG: site-2 protease family protein [Nocardioides sp.]|nr:site-2 protease family protein [Nocardioides sp.]
MPTADSPQPATTTGAPGPTGGEGSPRRPRPAGTFKIGTVAGSDVLVSSSWFLVAGLIAVVMAPRVEQLAPGLGPAKYLAGFAFAVILYLSILLHEASHAFMARHFGYPVSSITLHFLGGMTAVEGEARRPRQEFLIAVVGPLTSIAVGLVALGLWFLEPEGLLLMAVEGLAGANLLVGVLNLVPGLPLDGGRVLKSAVWGLTGDMHRGTIVAGWGGRIAAGLVLLWPVAQSTLFGTSANLLDFVLAFIVATFLWSGATAAITSARLRRRLPQLVARDLARRALSVPEDLPLSEAVRRAREADAGGIVTVTRDGVPVGMASEAAIAATPEDRRPWIPTSPGARPGEGLQLPVGIDGEALVEAITRTPATEYLLVEPDGAVYGVLSTADVDRAFRRTVG